MKKGKDEIDLLLAAYPKASAKRLAEEKKLKDSIEAEYKAKKLYEESVRKVITKVFRPVMRQLLARLDKTLFTSECSLLGHQEYILEKYSIKAVNEEDVEFVLSLSQDDECEKAFLYYSYSLNDDSLKEYTKSLEIEAINAELIKKIFIKCLKKICE